MNANEMSAWIRFGGGQELWDELSARFGIKALAAANSGVQMGGWFKKPIESLEDFRGLKIRMPGLGGEVIKRVGAAAITLPGSEIFPALQSGAIDGTEWVGPWNDLAFGFYKVAKHYYYPGFHEPGSVLSVGFNKEVWDRFSPAQQEIVDLAASAEYELSLAEFDTENARSFQDILAMPDVTVGPFPEDVVQALAETAEQVVSETASHDDLTRRIHDSFMAFRKSSIDYNRVSELAFAQARLAATRPSES